MLLDADAVARVGKSHLIQAFARSCGVGLKRLDFDVNVARGFEMRWRRIQVATWQAAVLHEDVWDQLIAESTHLVLVLDGQLARKPQTTSFLDRITKLTTLPKAGCVVWTKGDLRPRVPWIPRSILAETQFAGWQTFKSRSSRPSSLVAPLEWLTTQILQWNALTTWR